MVYIGSKSPVSRRRQPTSKPIHRRRPLKRNPIQKGVHKVTKKAKSAYVTARNLNNIRRYLPQSIYYGVRGSPSVLRRWRQDGAIVYPGSRYIGPGNKLDEGHPRFHNDHLAYVHDHQYDELEKKGVNPYFTWNEADREMLSKTQFNTPSGAAIGLFIGGKRIFPTDRTKVTKVEPYTIKYGSKSKKNK